MILWFGKKKKREEAEKRGKEIEAEEARQAALEAEAAKAAMAAEDVVEEVEPVDVEPVAPEPIEVQPEPIPEPEPTPEVIETRIEEVAEQSPEIKPEIEAGPSPEPEVIAPKAEPYQEPEDDAPPEPKKGFFSRLTSGLARSSSKLTDGITSVFAKKKLDEETLEELEDLLISSDLGSTVAARITKNLAKDRFEKEVSEDEIKSALASEVETVLSKREVHVDFADGPRPRIVLFVGVNGSGKTTTIGKIASTLKAQGAKALLVAGDTFRAAAIEQLTVWGERADIPVMAKAPGADAAGLVYEAVERAKAEDLDLVLVDTAGRLQNKAELMDELAKVIRVTKKLDPEAPHDVILVLDATVGQNALSQVEAFRHTAGVTGLVMTKLDGTAKGGVLVAIAEAHDLPIHFVGVGEKAEDLQPFSAKAFSRALVGLED